MVGPATSPIIKRLIHLLKKKGVKVKLASFDAGDGEADFDLGPLKSFKDYFKFGKLKEVIKLYNPDVVHAHVINHYGLTVATTNKPVLLAAWGSDVLLANKSGNKIKDFVFTLLNRIGAGKADHLHTSSANVSSVLVNEFGCSESKISTFYWGLPLIPEEKPDVIKCRLASEFGLVGDGFIVFNRGLDKLYSPELYQKIIKDLANSGLQNKIVVFKGFASEQDLSAFKQEVGDQAIIIDRLLNDSELHWIYLRSCAHFSLPKSDALGGGVIEPALLGSMPILSELAQYQAYVEHNPGIIYSEDTHDEIVAKLLSGDIHNSSENAPDEKYQGGNIIDRFIEIYTGIMKSC